MKLRLTLLLLLPLILLAVSSCGFPKVIRTMTVDATLASITYPDYSTKTEPSRILYVDSPQFSRAFGNLDPVQATSEQAEVLIVGRSYRFVIKVWSNGWGPFYILESATQLQ